MNMKNRDFGKKDPQNLHSERGTIAERPEPSENANYEVNPTQPGVPGDRFDLWGRAPPGGPKIASIFGVGRSQKPILHVYWV